jgi:hypothetical protein
MDPLTNATVASAVTVRDSGSGPLAPWSGSARPRAPKLGPGGPSGAAPQPRHAADRSAGLRAWPRARRVRPRPGIVVGGAGPAGGRGPVWVKAFKGASRGSLSTRRYSRKYAFFWPFLNRTGGSWAVEVQLS